MYIFLVLEFVYVQLHVRGLKSLLSDEDLWVHVYVHSWEFHLNFGNCSLTDRICIRLFEIHQTCRHKIVMSDRMLISILKCKEVVPEKFTQGPALWIFFQKVCCINSFSTFQFSYWEVTTVGGFRLGIQRTDKSAFNIWWSAQLEKSRLDWKPVENSSTM